MRPESPSPKPYLNKPAATTSPCGRRSIPPPFNLSDPQPPPRETIYSNTQSDGHLYVFASFRYALALFLIFRYVFSYGNQPSLSETELCLVLSVYHQHFELSLSNNNTIIIITHYTDFYPLGVYTATAYPMCFLHPLLFCSVFAFTKILPLKKLKLLRLAAVICFFVTFFAYFAFYILLSFSRAALLLVSWLPVP